MHLLVTFIWVCFDSSGSLKTRISRKWCALHANDYDLWIFHFIAAQPRHFHNYPFWSTLKMHHKGTYLIAVRVFPVKWLNYLRRCRVCIFFRMLIAFSVFHLCLASDAIWIWGQNHADALHGLVHLYVSCTFLSCPKWVGAMVALSIVISNSLRIKKA